MPHISEVAFGTVSLCETFYIGTFLRILGSSLLQLKLPSIHTEDAGKFDLMHPICAGSDRWLFQQMIFAMKSI